MPISSRDEAIYNYEGQGSRDMDSKARTIWDAG